MEPDGDKDYAGNGAGDGDIKATGDRDGTVLNAGAGNDILRGGKYDDILTGGSGNDQMFGGAGADQFRFFGTQIDGSSDSDRIYDLKFGEGDSLVFGAFAAGTFADDTGINAFDGGASAQISSWAGLISADEVSDWVTVSKLNSNPENDNLLVVVVNGGQVQEIVISNGWSQYVAAGGIEILV